MAAVKKPVPAQDTVRGLGCRECGREYPAAPVHVCEFCFGPLEVQYDYDALAQKTSREKIACGPRSIWRYRDFLPVAGQGPDFQVGFTPLIKADRLGREIGLKELYIKNDSVNPTFSFKDRVVAVALAKAVEFGFDTVACVSTGNLACATAAGAARAGLRCHVLVPAGLEKGKINNMAVYGPHMVLVAGSYDEVNRLGSELADRYDWAFVNINLRPFYAEGSKTLGFETVEQLGWRAPDHVVVPVASGSLLTKIYRGIVEMQKVGLIDPAPVRVSGAQAAGCAPVATAFAAGTFDVRPVKPETIAKSLAIGNPADGYYALKTVRETGGYVEQADDGEIVAGIRLLAATEGIFTEPAGGVTVAVLKKLAAAGKIRPDETTVAYITGNGLKAQEAVEETVDPSCIVEPNLASVARIVERKAW